VKYPKLAAAIDELLAKMVKEQGEDSLMMAVGWVMAQKGSASSTEGAVQEKLPPIPVTKEEVVNAD